MQDGTAAFRAARTNAEPPCSRWHRGALPVIRFTREEGLKASRSGIAGGCIANGSTARQRGTAQQICTTTRRMTSRPVARAARAALFAAMPPPSMPSLQRRGCRRCSCGQCSRVCPRGERVRAPRDCHGSLAGRGEREGGGCLSRNVRRCLPRGCGWGVCDCAAHRGRAPPRRREHVDASVPRQRRNGPAPRRCASGVPAGGSLGVGLGPRRRGPTGSR